MAVPNVAKEFLNIHLPENIKKKIDYNSLVALPDTFIDPELRRSQVDVLFEVKCDKKDLMIYIHIEQQSAPDYTMPTRRLSYKSDIWAAYRRTHPNQEPPYLPEIIDLHFYTGATPFDGALSIGELAGENAEAVNRCLIDPMINVWAGDVSEKQLKTHPWAATVEYIMAQRRTNDLRALFKALAPNIKLFYIENAREFVINLYTYIENIYDYKGPIEDLAKIVNEEVSQMAAEDMMTIAERLINRGREEGIIKERTAMAIKMLKDGVDLLFISKFTELSVSEIKKLQEEKK